MVPFSTAYGNDFDPVTRYRLLQIVLESPPPAVAPNAGERTPEGMSTPTTAVATLPPHYHHAHAAHSHPHHAHHSHHSHHHAHQGLHPSSSTTSNYRSTAANSLLHPSNPSIPASSSSLNTACLLPFENHQGSHTAGYSPSDGVAQNHHPRSPPVPPPHDYRYLHRQEHAEPSTPTTPRLRADIDRNRSSAMASATATVTAPAAAAVGPPTIDDAPSRKRRRSREPDWNNFYRNGLPQEVIVIDDTPEPEANIGRKLTQPNTNGDASAGAASYDTSAPRQPAKRRRRDAASGYHVHYVGSHTSTPLQHGTPIGSTASSDRTHSYINTTAPTSLSSNSQYDEPQAPLKRKRTTRQQAASEAKRRDVDGLGASFLTYKPPPFPPKKVSDVHVRVVHDVSDTQLLPSALLHDVVLSFQSGPPPLHPFTSEQVQKGLSLWDTLLMHTF